MVEFTEPERVADAAERLIDRLKGRTTAFTYAVLPNKAVRRQSVAAQSSGSIGVEAGRTGARSSVDQEAVGMQRDPVSMGFGDWDDVRGSGQGATRFGWVMFPSGMPSRAQLKRQSPESYSVSALVSLPGWWKIARVQVKTCWISESDLRRTADLKTVCPDRSDGGYEFDLRLPGDAAELMQNLRFRVVTFPSIDRNPADPPSVVEVGRSADILIRGWRLWRSPIVRLGPQKADVITVFPDMRGLIAHFECVHPEPGTEGGAKGVPLRARGGSEVEWRAPESTGTLQVFTSEGKGGTDGQRTHCPDRHPRCGPLRCQRAFPPGF